MGHRDLLVTQIYLRAESQTPALTHAPASAVPAASFSRANQKEPCLRWRLGTPALLGNLSTHGVFFCMPLAWRSIPPLPESRKILMVRELPPIPGSQKWPLPCISEDGIVHFTDPAFPGSQRSKRQRRAFILDRVFETIERTE